MNHDTSRYERFIQPIEGQMMRCVWRVVQDPIDAADAFQNAMATIIERLGYIERHPNPKALVLRICINAAYDYRRRSSTRRKHETSGALPEVADPAPGVADRMMAREQRQAVLDAIGRLPRRQAETVLMRLLLEQSYADISQALGCNEATVRTHFLRGRARLSRTLAPLIQLNSREASNE